MSNLLTQNNLFDYNLLAEKSLQWVLAKAWDRVPTAEAESRQARIYPT